MSTFRCPHCSVALSATELKEGWCEQCGKHVPEHLLSAAAKEDRQHRHDHLTHKQAALPAVAELRVAPTEEKDREPARPLPVDMIRRVAGIVLALIALGTMVLPWGRYKDPVSQIELEQSGLQMLYGGMTIHMTGTVKMSDVERIKKDHHSERAVPRLILGFPVCLMLALGALLLLEVSAAQRWAATWGTLAGVFVLLQLAVGLPGAGEAIWFGLTAAFLLVLVSIWPAAPEPEAGMSAWAVAVPVLLLASVLYAGSFFLTAISLERPQGIWTSYSTLAAEANKASVEYSGEGAYSQFYLTNAQCWYANPVGWIAWLLVLCRRWLWAATAAALATWLALTYFVYAKMDEQGHGCTWGYWIWVSSFAVLLIGSLGGWVTSRTARR